MRQASRGICAAGVVLLLMVGCAVPDYLAGAFFQSSGPGGERVVAGSLETVTNTTANTLMQLGLKANVTQSGTDVRIDGESAKGEKFSMVLTRVQTDQGERTRIRLEWLEKSRPDHETGGKIARIDAQAKT